MKTFTHDFKIQLDDLDYMGIVGNANWQILLERARIKLLEDLGYSFLKMIENKIGGVVTEISIKYLSQGKFNNKISIEMHITEIHEKGAMINYKVYDFDNKNKLYVVAFTKILFVNELGRPIFIPDDLKIILNNLSE